MNLAVRTSVDPKSTLVAIQSAIREVDKDQPVYQVQTMDEMIGDTVGTRRFALMILAGEQGLEPRTSAFRMRRAGS